MQFGLVGQLDDADAARAAGWDYLEVYAQPVFEGLKVDGWDGAAAIGRCALPARATCVLVPAEMKLTGPDVDGPRVSQYIERVMDRAARSGVRVVVLGSGAARRVPEGFDLGEARRQLVRLGREWAARAESRGLTIVLEPLNRGESNLVNNLTEAMEVVRAVGHAHFQCLFDSYHFWAENDSLDALRMALPAICHVHLADARDRTPPGQNGTDFGPVLSILKHGGYNGIISVESPGFDVRRDGERVLGFLKAQWASA